MERTQVEMEMTMKVDMDETKIYEDCNDDTNKESCYTEEEEKEREEQEKEREEQEKEQEKEDKANENDETDKESCYTQEEEQEREDKSNENKDKENHLRRKEIEDRNKNGGLQKQPLCVTFSEGEEGVVDNSHQSESSDGNSIRVLVEEEEEEDDTGEPVWKKWKKAFRWNDFFYGLIFGLGPTSWDVLSDLRFGRSLAESGDSSSAGLCFLFVTIPGAFFLQEVIMQHIFKDCSSKVNTMVFVASSIVATTAIAFGFYAEPLLFHWPATILGCSLIRVKLVGVFVHTPEMKAFSVRISAFEYTTESNLQLLFYLWLQLEKKDDN